MVQWLSWKVTIWRELRSVGAELNGSRSGRFTWDTGPREAEARWEANGKGIPLGRGLLWLRGKSWGYREGRQGPTLSVRDRGGASDQRPLLFTRPWNSSQALVNQRQKTTAHSGQTLWTESRHHQPTSHFDALHADWRHRELVKEWWGPSSFLLRRTGSWHFRLAFLRKSSLHYSLEDLPVFLQQGQREATEVRVEAQPCPQTRPSCFSKGNSPCLCCTGSRKQVVEATFLHWARPWG